MTELLTAAQMRTIEQAAIDSGEVTGLELMERAGRGVVEAIFEEWPELAITSHRAVVLCGPGNNGGDGFVVARLLKEWGWEVEVFLYGDPEKLPPDAKVNHERWAEMGQVGTLSMPTLTKADADCLNNSVDRSSGTALLVDALFGTGLSRPIAGLTGFLASKDGCAAMPDQMPLRTVSVDIPSGLCADSGHALGSGLDFDLPYLSFQADLTVSFHSLKAGHLMAEAPLLAGKVIVKDIGLERCPAALPGQVAQLIEQPSLQLSKRAVSHKYTHGHALILCGGPGRTGAARLAARGALRVGAGLATLGVPPSARQEVASQITALMLRRVDGAESLTEMLMDARLNALCLGPGLGVERARELVPPALGEGGVKPRPTVLDADALTAFQDDPAALFAMLHESCVLTPHAGEFARLFPEIADKLNAKPTKGPAYSKVDATREAARRAGCVVLFKGPDTVIAASDGRASVNSAHYDRAAPWLATAGSGDVLAGLITGLLARGFAPMQAAETGAWLHVECALSFGPGLIAEDIAEELPKVFRELGL